TPGRREEEAGSGEKSIKTTRRWWKDAEAQVDDWVTDFMRNCQQRLGLPADPAAWPKPKALQSIWRFHAYKSRLQRSPINMKGHHIKIIARLSSMPVGFEALSEDACESLHLRQRHVFRM